jgi:hypothetical protein
MVATLNISNNSSSNCRKRHDSGDGSGGRSCNICKRRFKVCGHGVPIPLSAGTFFSMAAFVLGGIALIFYYDRTANRNLSPAESRNLVCACSRSGRAPKQSNNILTLRLIYTHVRFCIKLAGLENILNLYYFKCTSFMQNRAPKFDV